MFHLTNIMIQPKTFSLKVLPKTLIRLYFDEKKYVISQTWNLTTISEYGKNRLRLVPQKNRRLKIWTKSCQINKYYILQKKLFYIGTPRLYELGKVFTTSDIIPKFSKGLMHFTALVSFPLKTSENLCICMYIYICSILHIEHSSRNTIVCLRIYIYIHIYIYIYIYI